MKDADIMYQIIIMIKFDDEVTKCDRIRHPRSITLSNDLQLKDAPLSNQQQLPV